MLNQKFSIKNSQSKILLALLCIEFIVSSPSFAMKGAPCAREVSTEWYECLNECKLADHACDKKCDHAMDTRLLECRQRGAEGLGREKKVHKQKELRDRT